MKKKLTLAVLLGATALTANAITITPGWYIGSGGPGTGESLAGDRLRSFQPTGGDENYLGVPSLGTVGNRVAQQLNWMTDANNPLTSFDFTFQYDQANDRLVSTIFGGTIYWNSWSSSLTSLGKTKGAADLNAFQISVGDRDTSAQVYLTNLVIDGITLGNFTPPNPAIYADWLVTGSDMNLTDGFTLTGTLWLEGPFSGSSNPENSVVNLTAGWDSRGVPPGVPDGGTTVALLGAALAGLAALRRKAA